MQSKRRQRRQTQAKYRVRTPIDKPAEAFRRSRVRRALKNALGGKIVRGRGGKQFNSTRDYYQHCLNAVRSQGLKKAGETKTPASSAVKVESAKEASASILEKSVVRYPSVSELSAEERGKCLSLLYPPQVTKTMNARKKYVCAVCKSVCNLFGLFVHMKQVHKGLLCQYCLKLFKRVPDLEQHMRGAHRTSPRYFPTAEQFAATETDSALVCATCSSTVRVDELATHACALRRPPRFDCPFCDRRFAFRNQLDLHLCNGWCKGMKARMAEAPTLAETAKMYKALTGLDLCKEQDRGNFDVAATVASTSILHDTLTAPSSKRKALPSNVFCVSDKTILARMSSEPSPSVPPPGKRRKTDSFDSDYYAVEGLPSSGSVYCGLKSRGVNNHVKKEIKDSGYKFDLAAKLAEADVSKSKKKKAAAAGTGFLAGIEITRAGQNFIVETPLTRRRAEAVAAAAEAQRQQEQSQQSLVLRVPPLTIRAKSRVQSRANTATTTEEEGEVGKGGGGNSSSAPMDLEEGIPQLQVTPKKVAPAVAVPPVKRETKTQRRARIAAEITANLYRIKDAVDLFRSGPDACAFCHHSQFVAVDATVLLGHLSAKHDLKTVLQCLEGEAPAMCATRIRKHCRDIRLREILFRCVL